MAGPFVSRGFTGKRRAAAIGRVPPGQYVTTDLPVLSAGRRPLECWAFTIDGLVRQAVRWTWTEFLALPTSGFMVDIHCVTKWPRLNTRWHGA